jgi:UPF0755 protein
MIETPETIKVQKNMVTKKHNESKIYSWFFMGVVSLVLFVVTIFISTTQPPRTFPAPSTIAYEKDEYLSTLTNELKQKGYIRSATLFKIFLKLSGREGKIKAGNYYFDTPLGVGALAHRFANGDLNQSMVRITIPEGSDNSQIAEILSERYPAIDEKEFVKNTADFEGKLFPETYFFEITTTSEEIITRMTREYDQKVIPLFVSAGITDQKAQNKVLILASLLEEEGKTLEDKQKIAGVLLRRIRVDMPLQVDATINYIKGEASQVYFSELEIDSPYNTYKNKGLPPGPITNPGLDSIRAALTPVDAGYLYYLTGSNGNFYFAKTFEEHVRNKEKYLR